MSIDTDIDEALSEARMRRRERPRASGKGQFKVLGVLILVILVLSVAVKVEPGHEGVVVNQLRGGVQDIPMSPGLHLRIPMIESVVPMETRIQKIEVATAASSKDLQDVSTIIALNFYIMPGSTPHVYSTIGLDYSDRVIMPAIEESTKAATAKYTAAELITERSSVKNDITANIEGRLKTHNIMVDQVSITNFSFSSEYTQAIENKQIAEQKAEQASRDLDRIQIEAKQRVTQAQAEANATRLDGDAKAYSIERMGEAMRNNPNVAQIKWIEKWNGELPFYTAGNSGNLMMVNASV